MFNSIIAEKSEDFGNSIVKLYKKLTINKKEYIISKQILRSGTSIGANIAEGGYIEVGDSKKLLNDCCEISKILNSIIKTTKINLNAKKQQ